MEKDYSYSFVNQKRDLGDELSTVIQASTSILSLFPVRASATQRKHEWLEDQIAGKRCTVTGAVSSLACPMSDKDLAKLRVGTLVKCDGDVAVFRVALLSASAATLVLVGANGSSKTTPANGDVLVVISTPEPEGSMEGTKFSHQSGVNFNYTQIFRKDIVLTGTALAIGTYGIENRINYQTTLALGELARDMNLTALHGVPIETTATVNGAAGGLFYFVTRPGGLVVDAQGAAFDSYAVNDAAQAITGEGGIASVILCSVGQARVLSADAGNRLVIMREDTERGSFAATVVNDVTGRTMRIFADPDMPDDMAIISDPAGFGLIPMNGRSIWDRDTTPNGFDGVRRSALGEYTFEVKNANQRLCLVKNLKSSLIVLAEKRQNVQKVEIIGGGSGTETGS